MFSHALSVLFVYKVLIDPLSRYSHFVLMQYMHKLLITFAVFSFLSIEAGIKPYAPHGILDGPRQPPKRIESSTDQSQGMQKIKYLIVIFQENWSFDALYGKFPGANGLSKASLESQQQVDLFGKPYPYLPTCIDVKKQIPYPQIPAQLPNAPFDLQPYIPLSQMTGALVHRFYQEQYQINGGKMNAFAAWSNAAGFVMSTYDASNTSMGLLAKNFVLCDNWFHSCYGGSMCGVLWLFSAQMPLWPNAPKELVAKILPSGALIKDGIVSPNGYAINDAEPFFPPYRANTPDKQRLPPQTAKTIGDLLSEKNVTWKWYAEGWDAAINGTPDPSFVFHHQAPTYFQQFAPGTKERQDHLADLVMLDQEINSGNFPSVVFIRSLDRNSEHPAEGTLLDGLTWCSSLIYKIQQSAIWNECAIIVTYDENGGRWDHVSPPVVDEFGPGTRVPAIIISPFAKKGFVDHTSYETVSILKFIEERWGLASLSGRDAVANNILNAFDFTQNQ
jgi:phospholipase C